MARIVWKKRILDILLPYQMILFVFLLIVTQIRCDSLTCPSKFGYFPDPADCQGYYICTFGTAKVRKCGTGLQYRTTTQTCDVVKASSADCEQDEGRALRPKYTGPTMKTADAVPAAAVPAAPSNEISMAPSSGSYDTTPEAAIATTKAYPIFPFQSMEDSQSAYPANSGKNPTQHDAAASQYQQANPSQYQQANPSQYQQANPSQYQQANPSQYQQTNPSQSLSITTRRPVIDQYIQEQQQANPGKGLAAKRPYDFWQPPTTASSWQLPTQNSVGYGYNATQRPITAQTKAKPFRDPSVFGNRPTFRPLKGATTRAPPVVAPPPEQPAPDQQQPAYPPENQQHYSRPNQQQSASAKFSVKQPDLTQNTGNKYQPDSTAAGGKFQYPQDSDNASPGDSSGPAGNPRLNWNTDRSSGQSTDDKWQANADSPPTLDNAASQQGSSPPVQPFSNKRTNEPKLTQNRDKNFVPEKVNRAPPSGPNVVIPTDTAMSQCSAERCQLPDCYCGSTTIPGGLSMADTPQMIILSFDAEINERNLPIYERLFHKDRKNPNNCNIKATFFVSHEYTNYGMVRYLYEKGHEIGSHSVTHGVGQGFKDEKAWETEMNGEKGFLASFAAIRPEDIKGARAPLLGSGGDDMFQALQAGGFLYDSSLVTPPTSSKASYWPYTMDYAMPHACNSPPCPQRGYRGLWELALNPIFGLFGESCYEADRCTFGSTGDEVYKLLYNNFNDRYYSVNKAPFHLALHADWLKYPPHREAYERFLDVVGSMPDVYIVTGSQAIAWMQRPTPLNQLGSFEPWQCNAEDSNRLPQCDTINACPLNFRDHLRYFYTCSECPAEFPWI